MTVPRRLRAGVSSGCFAQPVTLSDVVAFGPQVVELYALPRDQCVALADALGTTVEIGLHVPTPVSAPPTGFEPTSPHEPLVEAALAMVLDTMAFAQEIRAQYVVMHLPSPRESTGDTERETKRRLERFVGRLTIGLRAGTHPHLLVENISTNPTFWSVAHYSWLHREFPQLGACLDLGHLADFGRLSRVLPDYLDQLAPSLATVHVYASAPHQARRRYLPEPGTQEAEDLVWALSTILVRTDARLVLELHPTGGSAIRRTAERWQQITAIVESCLGERAVEHGDAHA